MSGNFSMLKLASVEPPPLVWEGIERRLNAHKVPEEVTCFAQLRDCSIAPPPNLKNQLFEALDSLLPVEPIHQPVYEVRKKHSGRILFPKVERLAHKRKIYWGMTGFIIISALIFSYLVLSNNSLGEAKNPSAKIPKENEQGSFTTPSVSDKNGGQLSF